MSEWIGSTSSDWIRAKNLDRVDHLDVVRPLQQRRLTQEDVVDDELRRLTTLTLGATAQGWRTDYNKPR